MDNAVALRAKFGRHSIEYYLQATYQQSRLSAHRKAPGKWNAFVHMEALRLNAGELGARNACSMFLTLDSELPAEAPRKKVAELMPEIAANWKKLTAEEKEAASAEGLKHIEDKREMKALSHQNVPLAAFHDARATLALMQEEVRTFTFFFVRFSK